MIRVLIADDHEIVREGLHLLLSDAGDLEVVGMAADGEEAVAQAAALRPDVLLLDLVMPRLDGIEAIRRVRDAGTAGAILVLTSFADEENVRAAVRAGAIGFLLKDMLRGDLVQAIRAAAAGQPTLHPLAQASLMRQVTEPPTSPHESLTDRERDVLRALAEGRSNKEIAARFGLTLGTVKGYVSAVLAKLGVADRTQAALYALRHGLVAADPDQS